MSWFKRENMYCRGRVIGSMGMLYDQLKRGRYLYVRGKLYHPKVVMNWPLITLECAIERRDAITAVKNPKYVPKEKDMF